jgi:serine/threonine-protein kinase RsbW
MGRTIQLVVPPQNRYLALVRRAVGTAARIHPVVPDRRIDDLSLAVSEACTNAINATRAHEATSPVRIDIELDDTSVAVTVTDQAGGFSLDDVAPIPSAEDPGRLRHERGLGLALIRNLSDDAAFTQTDDGTAVRMVVIAPD